MLLGVVFCVVDLCCDVAFLLFFLMFFLSLLLYAVCLCMFSVVGLSIRFLCSSCCRLICRLNLGVHHGCLRNLGARSCCSMLCWSAVCILWKCCAVDVVVGLMLSCEVIIAACRSGRILSLWAMYLLRESVFLVLGRRRGGGREKMA